ncbi:MAG TPA: tetratricopeptide repeat protein, partial [Tepidisphaeraceae bacterium]|nr:tetratricopeptide repeat protein [Tepidisphaeraceae bacterium]
MQWRIPDEISKAWRRFRDALLCPATVKLPQKPDWLVDPDGDSAFDTSFRQGIRCAQRQDYESAMAYFDQVLALDPLDAD